MNEGTTTSTTDNFDTTMALTADIVSAFVGNQSGMSASDLPALIANVHSTLVSFSSPQAEAPAARAEPAVSIRASIKPDFIVCLEDGKKLKMLKRHLMTHYQMTPDQYRAKWGLNADYPMVAPNYAETRRALAKKIGLGTLRTRTTGDGEAGDAERKPARARKASAPRVNKDGSVAKKRGPKAKSETAEAA